MDALVSLRPCAVEYDLGDWTYTIPELPAVDWIEAILAADGMAIVPGLVDDDEAYRDVVLGLARKTITPEEVADAAREVLAAASGRPWWAADRLIRSAAHPDVWAVLHGRLKLSGFNVQVESIGAFCDAIYAMAIENMTEEQRSRLDADLNAPPPGTEPEQAMDGAADAFMAAIRQQQQLFDQPEEGQ